MQDEEKIRVHTQVSFALQKVEQFSGFPEDGQCPQMKRDLRSQLQELMRSGRQVGEHDWHYKVDLYEIALSALNALPTDPKQPIPAIILEEIHVQLQLAAVMVPETVMVNVGGTPSTENRISRYL